MKTRSLTSLLILAAVPLIVADCSPRKVASACPPTVKSEATAQSSDGATSRLTHVARRHYSASSTLAYIPSPNPDSGYAQSYYDYNSSSSVANDNGGQAQQQNNERRDEYAQSQSSQSQSSDSSMSGGAGHWGWMDGYGQGYVVSGGAGGYNQAGYYNSYNADRGERGDSWYAYDSNDGLHNGY